MIKDPNMLLSIINTKLRDFYESLEDLCEDLDYDIEDLLISCCKLIICSYFCLF